MGSDGEANPQGTGADPTVHSNRGHFTVVRPAHEVIDSAIRENRAWEYLAFALTSTFALVGITVIVVGTLKENGLVALSGAVAASLFWPALHNARGIRRENIAIRLLEVPLGQAKSAPEAAKAIADAFGKHFGGRQKDVAANA